MVVVETSFGATPNGEANSVVTGATVVAVWTVAALTVVALTVVTLIGVGVLVTLVVVVTIVVVGAVVVVEVVLIGSAFGTVVFVTVVVVVVVVVVVGFLVVVVEVLAAFGAEELIGGSGSSDTVAAPVHVIRAGRQLSAIQPKQRPDPASFMQCITQCFKPHCAASPKQPRQGGNTPG